MSAHLSVVIIAKNAADLLPDCLASLDWVDEIILLDSGSTDNTVVLARASGVKVFIDTDWQGYGIQRQRAQHYATGEYVLMVDTDERLTPELKLAIQAVLASPPNDGDVYSITRRNYFLGRFMRHSGWYPDRVLRLYSRERYQYNDNQIHESLACGNARIIPLKGDLLHLTCQDFTSFQMKQLYYATIWAQEKHKYSKKISFTDIFTHAFAAFMKTLFLRGGILDGKYGWLLAGVNAQYTFNKYTELWALNHGYSLKKVCYENKNDLSGYFRSYY